MSRRERIRPERLLHSRPVVVTIVLALLAAAWMSWLYATSDAKIAPSLLIGDGRKAVIVELRFPPEKFHMLLLQKLGRIQSVEGRSVHLLDVPPGRIREFARHYWVTSIDAERGTDAIKSPPPTARQ